MSKRKQNSSFKFVCAIAISLFSLVVLFVGTFAWFQSVRALQNTADDFYIQPATNMIKRIKVYNQVSPDMPYVFQNNPVVTYKVDGENVTKESGNPDNIGIRAYSSLSEQEDSTILYLFEINKSENENLNDFFSINIKTNTPDSSSPGANGTKGSLVFKDSNGFAAHPLVYDVEDNVKPALVQGGADPEKDFGLNSMSSVVAFNVLPLSTAPSISTIEVETEENTTESINVINLLDTLGAATPMSFVNEITNENEEDEEDSDLEENGYSYTTFDIAAYTWNKQGNATCPSYVAIACHYNAGAIQYIFNLNLGNDVANYPEIKFTCDWYYELK